MENFSQDVQEAFKQAQQALKNSYAPYSQLHVACAIKKKNASVFVTGVNVENASYGGTICAERSALVSYVSQFGAQEPIEFVVVISDLPNGPIPPCGLCLQMLKEFVVEDCPVYLGSDSELTKSFLFKDFLPLAFSSDMLPDKSPE